MNISQIYKLPKGVQKLTRTTLEGIVVTSYRVQMNRKELKVNKLFSDLETATSFLNLQRKKLGLRPVPLVFDVNKSLESYEGQLILQRLIGNIEPNFSDYVTQYLKTYIEPKFPTICPVINQEQKKRLINKISSKRYSQLFKTAEDKKLYRQYYNIVKFYEIIGSQYILLGTDKGIGAFHKLNTEKKRLNDCTIEEITPNVLNSYIVNRTSLQKRRGTIERELTFISNIFTNLKYFNEKYLSHDNPVLRIDKKLLSFSQKPKKRFFRFEEEQLEKYLSVIDSYSNKDMSHIVKLMLHTGMRRSEVVLLKWSQIYDSYIELETTKTDPRTVFLTKKAKDILTQIPKTPRQDRLFKYTVSGFEGSYTKLLKSHNMEDITVHKLRKEAVSNFIEQIGGQNSLLIAEILGITNIRHLEKTIKEAEKEHPTLDTQQGILKSIGHKNPSITSKHYFSLKKQS
ncbi:site-specific integrase [Comamonas testosteroni]|uniref:site-specific integrase n=1 Tax=Comamonas testosteroni TaxID=285 RepID=UPI0015FB5D3E|nr:site-specific integrase [Comamonas testosteroni]